MERFFPSNRTRQSRSLMWPLYCHFLQLRYILVAIFYVAMASVGESQNHVQHVRKLIVACEQISPLLVLVRWYFTIRTRRNILKPTMHWSTPQIAGHGRPRAKRFMVAVEFILEFHFRIIIRTDRGFAFIIRR